jgi:hypothetical protein
MSYVDTYVTGYHFVHLCLPDKWDIDFDIDSKKSSGMLESLIVAVHFNDPLRATFGEPVIQKGTFELKIIHSKGQRECKIIDHWYNIKEESYPKNSVEPFMSYWTTQPDGKTLEFCALFGGICPTNSIDYSVFQSDLSFNINLESLVEFSYENFTLFNPENFHAFIPQSFFDNNK